MPISVRCSKCGHSYQLRDELAGKQAKCRCGETLSIPVATPLTSLLDEEHIGDSPDAMGEGMPPAANPRQGQGSKRHQSSPQFGKGFQGKKKKGGKDNTTTIIASVAGGIVGLFVVLLLVFLLTGSDDKPRSNVPPPPATAGPPPVASLPGQATPEETFETFKQAWVGKDWARIYSLLTPQAREQMTTVIAMMSAMLGPMNPEFAAVAKKHGIDASGLAGLSMGGADPFAEEQPAEPNKKAKPDVNAAVSQAMGVAAKIKDKKGFFIDALPVFLKFIQSKEFAGIAQMGSQFSGVSITDGLDMLPMFTTATTLHDVRVNGATASAVAKTPAPAAPPGDTQIPAGKEKATPLEFEQTSGSWYLGSGLR
ncbi:MAG: hypothetical protein U9N87_01395 [Planctomycetota bacterium]|nr:hypothetical protein [Planctomycetota bacterium]